MIRLLLLSYYYSSIYLLYIIFYRYKYDCLVSAISEKWYKEENKKKSFSFVLFRSRRHAVRNLDQRQSRVKSISVALSNCIAKWPRNLKVRYCSLYTYNCTYYAIASRKEEASGYNINERWSQQTDSWNWAEIAPHITTHPEIVHHLMAVAGDCEQEKNQPVNHILLFLSIFKRFSTKYCPKKLF